MSHWKTEYLSKIRGLRSIVNMEDFKGNCSTEHKPRNILIVQN